MDPDVGMIRAQFCFFRRFANQAVEWDGIGEGYISRFKWEVALLVYDDNIYIYILQYHVQQLLDLWCGLLGIGQIPQILSQGSFIRAIQGILLACFR